MRLGPLFATVTWGAGGSTASRSLELAEYLQVQLGLNTCLHLTCTNMRRRALDDALDACHSLGIRNLLALRGDEPRDGEYDLPDAAGSHAVADADEPPFRYAVDLVRHIRQRYGDYFCIGVAAYPEGHADSPYDTDSRSPERDLPHLAEKTQAGADFIMTQLFYDSKAYLSFERMLRDHPSKAFDGVPLIPGLMPVQSWAVLSRTTRLACATVPPPIMNVFEADKGDDAKVKARGVDLLSDIVTQLGSAGGQATSGTRALAQGFHFYTLNLEKAVAQILDRCQLTRVHDSQLNSAAAEPQVNGTNGTLSPAKAAVKPKPPSIDQSASGPEVSKMDTLSISEGQGGVGREATWDDYPNGRWGDARSPAYGSIDGYGPSLHVSPAEALRLWGSPTTMSDIGKLFSEYLNGKLAAIPWSEESLSEETNLIRDKLLQLSEKSWWSVASQPAVDAARSDDKIHGWGPATGGWVWQKVCDAWVLLLRAVLLTTCNSHSSRYSYPPPIGLCSSGNCRSRGTKCHTSQETAPEPLSQATTRV